MRPVAITVIALLCSSANLFAQDAPEDLLPATTQLYARWDGVTAHTGAYTRSALGKMLAGDTGQFLGGLVRQIQEMSGTMLTQDSLLKGMPPERLQQIQADVAEALKLVPALSLHGVVVGVEVRGLEPPTAQFTLIVPDLGKAPMPLFGALRLLRIGLESDLKDAKTSGPAPAGPETGLKELKISGRTVYHLQPEPWLHLAWWVEGKHAVFVAGTDTPQACVERMAKPGPRLSANPLFKRVQGFSQFETGARAFLDVASVVKVARTRSTEFSKLLTDLGMEGVKSWTFYSGFDGASERAVSELEMPGPRQGLLRLLTGKTFALKDVPPIPPDSYSWSATNFDPAVFYDTGLKALESGVAVFSPESVPMIAGFLKKVDEALAINLRRDLLGSLGDRFITYSSAADGPLTFGQVYVLKVKDPAKLQAALGQALRSIGKLTGVDVSLQKKTYHGVALSEIHVRQQGFIFVPTFAIQGDYLALSFFPQPVHGFILRSKGELPSWKPGQHVEAALGKLPKEFVAISVSDPRPTLQQVLSLAPLIGGAVRSFAPESKFDVGSIPNGHEATSYLYPNVTVVSDDGKVLRSETLASLILPFDVVGVDSYIIVAFLSTGFFGFVGF
ncbi:MAG TPA: hypothetical protein VGP68_15100 [Gemmataceae bacterium]|jgi:hypothetical protein|nr:hypothetical protein [Gemmataceae bacterium]